MSEGVHLFSRHTSVRIVYRLALRMHQHSFAIFDTKLDDQESPKYFDIRIAGGGEVSIGQVGFDELVISVRQLYF